MTQVNEQERKISAFREELLAWYRRHRRDLPWRRSRDPYAIWVSEIMLQQTRVAAVVERYGEFLQRFPTVASLAAASEQEVLAAWSGLGYYRRARMLHQGAKTVAAQPGGRLPLTAEALRSLPGIGAYTAAAIASIAYAERVAVVDGNVERVLCRLEGWEAHQGTKTGPLRRRIEAQAEQLVDSAHPGDFNQAMMELGAVVCTPRAPECLACPVSRHCKTRGEHRIAPRPAMRNRETAHALTVREKRRPPQKGAAGRQILLEQRPAHLTVMPGLWELPVLNDAAVPEADLRLTVRHTIMNVNYLVRIRAVPEQELAGLATRGGKRRWVLEDEAAQMALTGLTRKVLRRAQLLPPRA